MLTLLSAPMPAVSSDAVALVAEDAKRGSDEASRLLLSELFVLRGRVGSVTPLHFGRSPSLGGSGSGYRKGELTRWGQSDPISRYVEISGVPGPGQTGSYWPQWREDAAPPYANTCDGLGLVPVRTDPTFFLTGNDGCGMSPPPPVPDPAYVEAAQGFATSDVELEFTAGGWSIRRLDELSFARRASISNVVAYSGQAIDLLDPLFWQQSVPPPPAGDQAKLDLARLELNKSGYKELRAWINWRIDPDHYTKSVPDDQTLGLWPDDSDAEVPPEMFEARSDGVDADGGATGNFTHARTDLTLPGAGVTFAWTRSYNSRDTVFGILGQGWSQPYNGVLVTDTDGNATVRSGTGQTVKFAKQPDGSFVAPDGVRSTLVKVGASWTMTNPGHNVFAFNSGGRMTEMKDRAGQGLAFTYSGGLMTQITDAAGRNVTLEYDPANSLLTKVTLSDGRYVQYTYTTGRLTSVRDARGFTSTHAYDAKGRLESMVDQRGKRQFLNTYDATSGRLVGQVDAVNATRSFAWDATTQTETTTDPRGKLWKKIFSGNILTREIDPLGNTTEYRYDDKLNRTATIDARGNRTDFAYDARGNLLTETGPAPLSLVTTRTYDTFDNVKTLTDPRLKTTTYDYNASNQLIRVTDAAAGVTEYTYTLRGQQETILNPRLKQTNFAYDAAGNPTSVITPTGRETTMTHDGSGRMLSRVSPRGNINGGTPNDYRTSYTYNDADQVLTTTDPLGHVTTFGYDNAGNQTTVTDANSRVTTTAYDDANRVVSITDPRNATTTMGYDPDGNIVERVSQTGDKTTYTFDDAGRMVSMTTPRGNVSGATASDYTWTYAYDPNANRTIVTNPTGAPTTTTYDVEDRPTVVTDSLNHATTTGYDSGGNITSVQDALSNTVQRSYDNLNRVQTITSARNKVTTFAYDPNGNRTSQTLPLNGKTTWSYSDDDETATMVEPLGNVTGGTPATYTTTYTHDPDGNQTQVKSPLNHTTNRTFDRDGNLATETDANGRVTRYGYDALDRLTSVTGPDAPTCTSGPACVNGKLSTVYTLDDTGNITARTDPNNHVTATSYDLAARVTQELSPTAQKWNYTYNPDGAQQTIVTARANASATPATGTITKAYDRVGRQTGTTYGGTLTPNVTYTYDNAGRRTSMIDGQGTETYGYDNADRLTSVARPATGTLSYGYDPDGNITTRTYPDSTAVTATFDDDGRVTQITRGTLTTNYGYDAAGRQTTKTLPSGNGHVETRTYDPSGRLTTVENKKSTTTLSKFTRTLDPVGNPTLIATLRGTTTTNEAFLYDAADRLTKWCQAASCTGAAKNVTYTYDPVGNRLTQVRAQTPPNGTTTYTYNASDQLTQTVAGGTTTNYTYDADGNQTAAGARSYTWDLENRMRSTTSGATTTNYTYDGSGKRFTRATGATINTRYAWDTQQPLPELILERTNANALTRRYIHGPAGDPLAYQTTATATWWYHQDPIGSVTDITSATGAAQWRYTYEPYGAALATTKVVGSAPINNTRYTGEYLDTETNEYYLRARQYDPITGRFLATDPVEAERSRPYVGSYSYAEADPTRLTDPSGLTPRRLEKGSNKKGKKGGAASQATGRRGEDLAEQALRGRADREFKGARISIKLRDKDGNFQRNANGRIIRIQIDLVSEIKKGVNKGALTFSEVKTNLAKATVGSQQKLLDFIRYGGEFTGANARKVGLFGNVEATTRFVEGVRADDKTKQVAFGKLVDTKEGQGPDIPPPGSGSGGCGLAASIACDNPFISFLGGGKGAPSPSRAPSPAVRPVPIFVR